MIDAHAHLSDPRLEKDVDELSRCLRSAGLKRIVLGGVSADEWDLQTKLKSILPAFVTPVFGIHPWTVRDHDETQLETMFEKLQSSMEGIAAIGEVGVDFYPKRNLDQVTKQSYWCRRQLELAQTLKKPVVLHVVQGHDVMQNLLKDMSLKSALIHGFKGRQEVSNFYLKRGYVFSLGARSFKGVALEDYRWLPKSQFVLESDAPLIKQDVSDPSKVCDDWIKSLQEAAGYLAKLWSISSDEVWTLAEANLTRFLHNDPD